MATFRAPVHEVRFTAPEIMARFVRDLEDPANSEAITVAEATSSLIGYCRYKTRGFYRPFPHLKRLAEALERVECGECNRLMIWMPPQHGKSFTATESFPGYYIGKHPDRRAAIASYGAELALDFGRKNRDDMVEFGQELWGVQVSRRSQAANRWDLEGNRGGMVAVGVGGALTGRGAHLLVIDDPFKDWEEAQSPAAREKVWNWYRSVARTRLRKGGAIVIIQTRWHEDDLPGRLEREMLAGTGEKWEILRLACEAEEDDPLGRPVGAPLCPDLGYDEAWLAATKKAVGSYIWSALYQGRPAPIEGGILKRFWWRYWKPKGVKVPPVIVRVPKGDQVEITQIEAVDLPDTFDTQLQSWDMTFKETADTDFVAGGTVGKLQADCFVLDMINERMDFPKSVAAAEFMARKWPLARPILVEDKANGPAVVSTLKHKIAGILEVTPEGGKEARAHAVSPFVESGNVYLPHPLINPLTEILILQCAMLPKGANDDLADMLTQALIRLFVHGSLKPMGEVHVVTRSELLGQGDDADEEMPAWMVREERSVEVAS